MTRMTHMIAATLLLASPALAQTTSDPFQTPIAATEGVIKEKNAQQGKPPATRADLRFGLGPDGQIFVLNKGDGVIRLLVPDRR